MRRTDLDLAQGELTVRGRGKKSGTTVRLIPTQDLAVKAALRGYLAALEECFLAGTNADYPLFPAGQLTGGRKDLATARVRLSQADADPIHRRAVLAWFHEAEVLAKIPVVPGRGWYGLRRANVDGAQEVDISRAGLKQFGGWKSSQVPDEVCAKRQAKVHVLEAAQVRAKIRGVAGVDTSHVIASESASGTVQPYPPENAELASQDDRPEGQL